jgi:hypothetical protein
MRHLLIIHVQPDPKMLIFALSGKVRHKSYDKTIGKHIPTHTTHYAVFCTKLITHALRDRIRFLSAGFVPELHIFCHSFGFLVAVAANFLLGMCDVFHAAEGR